MNKVKYLKHPVSAEKKAEWNKKGYRIIDAKFDPSPPKTKRKKAE